MTDNRFHIVIHLHTDDARQTLSDPGKVREIVGDAIDRRGINEEIDYTLEVERGYEN